MTDGSALLTQVAAALTSGPGMGVLAVGVIAAVAFGLFIFRDDVPLIRRGDGSLKLPLTRPPRLSDPSERMDRAREKFWDEGKGRALMTAFQGLGLVAIVVAAMLIVGPSKVGDAPSTDDKAAGGDEKTARLSNVTAGRPAAPARSGTTTLNAYSTPFCETAGSLDAGFVEFCANGSAVRMELVRLRFEDRFVVEPLWVEKTCDARSTEAECSEKNALSLVSSESHPAPFAMGAVSSFDAPLTSSLQGYDGLFVVGAATNGLLADVAEERRRALFNFAEFQVCGIEGPGCELARQSVFSATARFSPPDCSVDEALIPRHFKNYCMRSNALKQLQRSGERAGDEQLGPELLVLGIQIDELSPSRQVDMYAAASCFLAGHQDELRIIPSSPVLGGGKAVSEASGVVVCQNDQAPQTR
ncbi:MAG: hypothetical protein AAF608_00910 [Pseudomonadota bacterium]